MLGAVSGKEHLVTSHLAVKESGAVSGGNHLVASPVEVADPHESICVHSAGGTILCLHTAGDTMGHDVVFGLFALLLGAVLSGNPSRLHLLVSSLRHTVLFSGHDVMIGTFALFLGAVFGGNHLLASPVDAAR